MPQNVAVFETAKLLMLSAAGTAASVASFGIQLNQPYAFFYLQLPLWFFYIAMVILAFIGAFFALMTDYMQSRGTKFGKFCTALSVGLIMSFIVLPTFVTEPSIGLMLITALFGSLSGTILLYMVGRLFSDEELLDAVYDLLKTRLIDFLRVFSEHFTKVVTTLAITVVASFIVLPSINDHGNDKAALKTNTHEVQNDWHC